MSARIRMLPGWAFPPEPLERLLTRLDRAVAVERIEDANVLLGWSLGGIRALLHPAPLPRILIASTAHFLADPPDWPGMPAANLLLMRRLFAREPERALRMFHQLCAACGTPLDQINGRVRASLDLDRAALARDLGDLAALDARPRLSAIDSPVLLLHGARDRVIPSDAARAMAQRLPHARLRIHADAEHDLPIREPDWIAAEIRVFIESLSLR